MFKPRIEIDYTLNVPKGREGYCKYTWYGAHITIKTYRGQDHGLLAHELFHARGNWFQLQWRGFMTHWFKKAKLKEEVAAYAHQIQVEKEHDTPHHQLRKLAAHFLDMIDSTYDLPKGLTGTVTLSDLYPEYFR